MRYVDIEALHEKPEAAALIAAASAAAAVVAAETDPEARRELIKKNRKRWTDFRDLLEQSDVGAKCWYTESCNPGTDDDVDHYRPKNGLAERPDDHPGYWWAALNWENFRLSCHRANRLRISEEEEGATLGKGEHFPIADERFRWMEPAETCRENPLLLDPTDPEDPQLLTFLPNGRTDLAPAFDADGSAKERYEQSRRYLHLDWERFVEDRSALFALVTRLVENGDESERLLRDSDDEPRERARLKKAAQGLIRLTKPDRAYSAAAIAYIRIHQDRSWIKTIVLPNIPGEL
jgi:hypothetical protein